MHAFHFLFAILFASPESLVESLRHKGASGIVVHRVQLDADAPLEAVIQYEMSETGVHAIVLDSQPQGWREAGRFNSWWSFEKADAARFLQFRASVDPDVQDLLLRTRSGGTEEARTTLDLYRMRKGALVNVLTATEYLSAMEHPTGEVFTTTAVLAVAPGRLMLRSLRQPGDRKTCQVYLWNPHRFRFEEDATPSADPCL